MTSNTLLLMVSKLNLQYENLIQECGEDCGGLSDCEELVGGYSQVMMEMPLSRVLVSEVVIICNWLICN